MLLSIMGRLGVSRSCVLIPDGSGYKASLLRGFPEFTCESLPEELEKNIISERLNVGVALPEQLTSMGIATTVPLVYDSVVLAVLCLGEMKLPSRTTEGLTSYLSLIKMMTTIAVHNSSVVASLIRTSEELRAQHLMVKTMFEISRDFTSAKSKHELLKIIALHLMGRLVITSFALCFNEPINGEQVIYTKQIDEDLEQLLPEVLEIERALFVSELDPHLPLTQKLRNHGVQLAVPMTVNGEQRGVLVTRGKLSKAEFTADDLVFLQAVGNTAMTAIDNERLVTAEILVKSELAIALEIQRDLMPLVTPEIDGLDIATHWQASRTIGGDYFDIIPVSEGRTLFAIADVAGKGVPAALLMANTQSALTILAQLDSPLTDIAHRLNTLLCENTKPEVFVTMFLALIDTRQKRLTYVSMGHNPPLLISNRNVEFLTEGGVLAGVIPDPPSYIMGERTLNTGDALILYTDGVTECPNLAGEEFGVERLTSIAMATNPMLATELCGGIVKELQEYSKGTQIADDTTIMVIKVV